MKLNSIKLSGPILSELYKKSLVEPLSPGPRALPTPDPVTTPVTRRPKKDESPALSQAVKEKNILIITDYPQAEHIPEEAMNFLNNLLSACKLEPADATVLNLAAISDTSYQALTGPLNSGVILLFGVAPASIELPVDFPYFQVQSFNNHTFLYTPLLDEIIKDRVLKSKLWVCLQKIFKL